MPGNPVFLSGRERKRQMEQLIVNLLVGAAGGNALGAAAPGLNMGTITNTITGLIGGGVLSQIAPAILSILTGAAHDGSYDVTSVTTQIIGSGAGGAILTAIVGLIKNRLA